MKFLIVIFAVFVAAQCNPTAPFVPCDGWPVVETEKILKGIDHFKGLHYLQYRSPSEKHTDVKCIHIKAEYNSDDSTLSFEKHFTDKETEKETKTPFKKTLEEIDAVFVNDKFCIRCRAVDGKPHLHIITRDRFPSEEVKKEITGILDAHKIDLASLNAVDQKNCDH